MTNPQTNTSTLTEIVDETWPGTRDALADELGLSRQSLHTLLTRGHARMPVRLLNLLHGCLTRHDAKLALSCIKAAWKRSGNSYNG